MQIDAFGTSRFVACANALKQFLLSDMGRLAVRIIYWLDYGYLL